MESQPRILFIAPSSFPIRNAEANANAKVLKLLSEGGYLIDLVCRSTSKQHYPTSDNDMFFGKLCSINVISLDSKADFATSWNHLLCFLKTGYLYRGCDWSVAAINLCDELIKKHRYDFIYTYNEPSELVGLHLSKKHKIKLVATWNDPYIWQKYPEPYGCGANYKLKNPLRRNLISHIGKYAYMHIFPSTRLRDYMMQYMSGITIDRSLICPHIVTNDLCTDLVLPLIDTLRIIHSGSLGIERDPLIFCKGFRHFLDKNPNAQIEFTFLGVFERAKGNYFSDLIETYGLTDYIKQLPAVTYHQSFDVIFHYDVCMLLEAQCKEGVFLPSKIADYIQANKPIFALSPKNGTINDLYLNNGIEYLADVCSVEAISDTIEQMYNDFINDNIKRIHQILEPYSESSILKTHKDLYLNSVNEK